VKHYLFLPDMNSTIKRSFWTVLPFFLILDFVELILNWFSKLVKRHFHESKSNNLYMLTKIYSNQKSVITNCHCLADNI